MTPPVLHPKTNLISRKHLFKPLKLTSGVNTIITHTSIVNHYLTIEFSIENPMVSHVWSHQPVDLTGDNNLVLTGDPHATRGTDVERGAWEAGAGEPWTKKSDASWDPGMGGWSVSRSYVARWVITSWKWEEYGYFMINDGWLLANHGLSMGSNTLNILIYGQSCFLMAHHGWEQFLTN